MCATCPAASSRQTQLRHWLMDIVEHLAAKEPDISFRIFGDQNTTRKKDWILSAGT